MSIVQISAFLENRVGRLDKIIQMLADSDINILAISLADTEDFGIVRLIVNDPARAQELLRSNNVTVKSTEVTVIPVASRPGGLAQIMTLLRDAEVNIEYMYCIAESKSKNPLMVFRFSNDAGKAIEALKAANITPISAENLV